MRNRAFRSIAAIVSILLLTGIPAQAGPVVVSEVIQVMSNYQNPPEIRLRGVSQGSMPLASGGRGIDVIDQGDVEGTVCDCGEVLVPGGFPKWPLLFLATIPLFFIHDCDDCDLPSPTPTPTPPGQIDPHIIPNTAPVPEPASLLLFGTGLAAFGGALRRRYAKGKVAAQIQSTEEE